MTTYDTMGWAGLHSGLDCKSVKATVVVNVGLLALSRGVMVNRFRSRASRDVCTYMVGS
jgi:hypothetical protein